jgi:hypothetical protein
MTKLSDKARDKAADKRARGSIVLKNGRILSVEDRAKLKARSENTPYLDKMLRYSN